MNMTYSPGIALSYVHISKCFVGAAKQKRRYILSHRIQSFIYLSIIHSFMHACIQHMFIESLLCPRLVRGRGIDLMVSIRLEGCVEEICKIQILEYNTVMTCVLCTKGGLFCGIGKFHLRIMLQLRSKE